MEAHIKIEGFPYSLSNNQEIEQQTTLLKEEKKWQSYRITVVILIPVTVIKVIYHIAIGIFGAMIIGITGSGEKALHHLKWTVSTLFQDVKEILGHLYLLIPFRNNAGFTMMASAIAYKKYYQANYHKDMETIDNRLRLILIYCLGEFIKVMNSCNNINVKQAIPFFYDEK